MKIHVKDLKKNMRVYDEDLEDSYRVFKDPEFKDDKWQAEVITSGDYVWYLTEDMNIWTTSDRKD